MSITSELKDLHSPASLWPEANFDLDAVAAALVAQADGSDTIRPGGGYLKAYLWSIVGGAVEFRLRQAYGRAILRHDRSVHTPAPGRLGAGVFHDGWRCSGKTTRPKKPLQESTHGRSISQGCAKGSSVRSRERGSSLRMCKRDRISTGSRTSWEFELWRWNTLLSRCGRTDQ
ncbi:MAG: hypothetical protein ACYDHP_11495 [Ferrimicrobium sp.]